MCIFVQCSISGESDIFTSVDYYSCTFRFVVCQSIQDPWIGPIIADRIRKLYPTAQRVDVNAGHCPHDEAPLEVNAAIEKFMESIRST